MLCLNACLYITCVPGSWAGKKRAPETNVTDVVMEAGKRTWLASAFNYGATSPAPITLYFLNIYFIFTYVCICVFGLVWGYPTRWKEVSNPPGARVTESCDHPNVGSENQILILYTSREHL